MSDDTVNHWTKLGVDALVGRKIIGFRYLDDDEIEELGWYRKAPVLILDNGDAIWASKDDEGNDAGALFTTIKDFETIPVI